MSIMSREQPYTGRSWHVITCLILRDVRSITQTTASQPVIKFSTLALLKIFTYWVINKTN